MVIWPAVMLAAKGGSAAVRNSARAALPHLAAKPTRMGAWLRDMLTRSHPNVVVVALAAKLARIVWAVLRHESSFDQGAVMEA